MWLWHHRDHFYTVRWRGAENSHFHNRENVLLEGTLAEEQFEDLKEKPPLPIRLRVNISIVGLCLHWAYFSLALHSVKPVFHEPTASAPVEIINVSAWNALITANSIYINNTLSTLEQHVALTWLWLSVHTYVYVYPEYTSQSVCTGISCANFKVKPPITVVAFQCFGTTHFFNLLSCYWGAFCPGGILCRNFSGGILSRGHFVQGALCLGFVHSKCRYAHKAKMLSLY